MKEIKIKIKKMNNEQKLSRSDAKAESINDIVGN